MRLRGLFTAAVGLLAITVGLPAQTPSFPAAISPNSHLGVAANNIEGVIVSGISSVDTTITITPTASTPVIPTNTIITIDDESMFVCAVVSNTLTIGTNGVCPSTAGRGFDNTTAANHAAGTTYQGVINAWYTNASRVEIQAIETTLGVNLSGLPVVIGGSDPSGACSVTSLTWVQSTQRLWRCQTGTWAQFNAATATALAAAPTNCGGVQVPTGVDATGNALNCHTITGGASDFASITSGTNTTATMVVGSGATLSATGGGIITATGVPAVGVTGTLPVTNGGTGVTASTGTGNTVLSTSPTLVTPVLGTPASGVATNLTGLPLSTGVTGVLPAVNGGTGVTSSTGTGNVVLSNSPTLVTPVLGTPASGIATNLTGLPLSTGVTGILPILNGGTGTTTATGTGNTVLSNSPTFVTPALGTPASGVATNLTGLPLSTGITGTLAFGNGGTSQTSYTDGQLLIGNTGTGGLSKTTLTAGANITITNGSGTIQIAASGGGGGCATSGSATQVLTDSGAGGCVSNAAFVYASGTATLGTAGSVVGAVAMKNATSGTVTVQPVTGALGTVTLSLPAATDTLVGKDTTDTFTNKTFDTTGNSLAIAGIAVTANTGTGAIVRATSATLVTPALGTPSSGTLTNATGLPIGSGVSGLAAGIATFLGAPSSANLATAVTDETGSGALVFATSPTLVTPALGTPASGVLTNTTGLPVGTGISGLGSGVAAFLATPSSANLITAVTDETGTGVLVFATSPTLVTPALGTPSAAVLTNATGLPVATGITGFGTGIATFLATPSSANLITAVTDETGSGALVFATSPTFVTPILGTPTSGTLTNATGLPISTGISGLGTGVASFLATPSSANLITAVTDETGTGALVFATSPTLVTPALGTPASGILTNATGYLWANLASPPFVTNAKTATYQVLAGDFTQCKTIPVASGTFTITLVASGAQPATGQCVYILNYGTGVVTLARSGQNINGAAANLTGVAGSSTAPTGWKVTSDGTDYIAEVLIGAAGTGTVTSIATTSPITGGTITNTGTIACATCGVTGTGLNQFASTTSAQLAGVISDETGTGVLVLATSPALVTPALGVATATSLNGLIVSTTTGTFTLTNAKTLAVTNTLTLSGTDSTVMTFPSTSATIARTDAANTFTGTQTVGALVATTVNGNTFTTGTGVLTIAAAKTLTANNSLTLAGTDSTTMTFPTTTATIARTDAAQTFTGVQTFSTPIALGSLASTVVNATSPGAGIAHFAGSTQTVTSSAIVNADITAGTIDVATKITGLVPLANGGTNCAAPFAINAQTATYQVLAADFTCFKTISVASGTFTITLVASGSQPAAGTWLKIINYGSGVVTVARSGQNINGGTASIILQSASATGPNEAFVHSDGTNYFIGAGFTNPLTTAGDVMYGGTTGLPTRLATGTAKQLLIAGSTPSYVDFPDVHYFPAANCVNAIAGSAWTLPAASTFAAACRAGTNNLGGTLQAIPSTGATGYFQFQLPSDWDTASQPYLKLYYGSGANTSGTVIWTVSTGCTKSDGSITDDPAYVAESAMATQTMAAASREWAQSAQFVNVTSGNNCIAGSMVNVKVVLSGTASALINLAYASTTTPRLVTVQAN